MQIRFMMVAAAALTLGASALAEPAKPVSQDNAQPANKPAQVVLASAEQVPAPVDVAEQQPATPVKHRAARVTTCRCGGQTPSEH